MVMVDPFWPIMRPLCEGERSIPLEPCICSTGAQAERPCESGSRFASEGKAQGLERAGQPLSTARIRGDHCREALAEDLLRTGRLSTKEEPAMKFQAHGDPQPGEISYRSHIAAVDPRRGPVTAGTTRAGLNRSRN
jgi:hypothetical protein